MRKDLGKADLPQQPKVCISEWRSTSRQFCPTPDRQIRSFRKGIFQRKWKDGSYKILMIKESPQEVPVRKGSEGNFNTGDKVFFLTCPKLSRRSCISRLRRLFRLAKRCRSEQLFGSARTASYHTFETNMTLSKRAGNQLR